MSFKYFLIPLIVIYAAGCGQKPSTEEPVVAQVNEQIITASEFKQEMDFKKRLNPLFKMTPAALEEQLQSVIDRRLLIDEAKKLQLDREEPFRHSIQLYWEQTLIRNLVKQKEQAFNDSVTVGEHDLMEFYERLSYQASFAIKKAVDKEILTPYLKVSASEIEWDEEIGPVAYLDVSSEVLANAFDLAEGEMGIAQDGDNFYLVYVRQKLELPIEPFHEIKDRLYDQVREIKVQRLFHQWLEGVKAESQITVNRDTLKGIHYAK